jgi:ATP-binding cassette subfamily C (CFTR/MRP) protein 1
MTQGLIELDQENVSNLGLHLLRHNITIIPQDPTLFTGTIRSNIDPFT